MVCARYQFHYLYRIERNDTGQYYIGIRSCNVAPESDVYWGSGIWITASVQKHGTDLFKKIILGTYATRELASLAESEAVTRETLLDPLCMNLKTGGEYITGVAYDPCVGKKISVALLEHYQDPAACQRTSEAVKKAFAEQSAYRQAISNMRRRVLQDPDHVERALIAVRKSLAETDRVAHLTEALNRPEVRAQRIKSMQVYAATDEGQENLSRATRGTVYMTNGFETRRVPPAEALLLLQVGWQPGNGNNVTTETRKKLGNVTRGRKWMYNVSEDKCRRALPEEAEKLIHKDGVMANDPKLLSRDEFREQGFARDGHRCVFCGKTAADTPEGKLDFHHLLERRLWPDGGYYIENGATVCEKHHLECEQTIHSVEDVRFKAGITKIHVPPQFYPDHIYDKWGNPILEDGRRGKGELFFDESVQKVLGEGGVLDLFTDYVKYGRTFHLPFSPGMHDDDKALKDCSQFEGKRTIWTIKADGENTTGYSDGHIHARSIDSRGGEDRAWVKQFLSQILYELPAGWRVCGENLWAEHSIHYDDLKSYFYGFSLWTDRNVCLSWDETMEYFDILGITPVEVVYDGIWDEKKFRAMAESLDTTKDERLVVRVADAFPYSLFKNSVAKWVRKGHVSTSKHWRAGRAFNPNGLAK